MIDIEVITTKSDSKKIGVFPVAVITKAMSGCGRCD